MNICSIGLDLGSGEDFTAILMQSQGMPPAIVAGESSPSRTELLTAFEYRDRALHEAWLKTSDNYAKSLLKEVLNPFKFFYLFPLGKKSYQRKLFKLPTYKITWIHDSTEVEVLK